MERLKKGFLVFMEKDPSTAKAFLYHVRVKAKVSSVDELFKDEKTLRRAVSIVLGKEWFDLFVRVISAYCDEVELKK
ncbi:MAG: hypothetical protein DRJ52_06805 [Thermoprotei archaeon]|nr:MAG: hypothetical protein DRJ52_06805 [Thermoprotei archaeon]RLE99689.1 MAG: hypothetical protein DRJ63_04615 [Thermoprotei archaeon]HDI74331.1 hypothetical protein [Thermoprotei archaeon]